MYMTIMRYIILIIYNIYGIAIGPDEGPRAR
jgi:hypothetical protein